MVANGNHQAASKPGAQTSHREDCGIADKKEPALADRILGKTSFENGRTDAGVIRFGEANLEFIGEFREKPTFLGPIGTNVVAGGGPSLEVLKIEFSGKFVKVEEFLTQGSFFTCRPGPLLIFNDNPEAFAESFHCFGERKLFGVPHECDDVSRLSTTEALEEPLVGIDMKRRGFFRMKRAQSLEARSRLSQRHDAGNNIDDVHPQLDVSQAGGFDDGHDNNAVAELMDFLPEVNTVKFACFNP